MTSCIHISRQVGFKAIFLFKMEGVKNLEIWRHRYINILSVSRDFLPQVHVLVQRQQWDQVKMMMPITTNSVSSNTIQTKCTRSLCNLCNIGLENKCIINISNLIKFVMYVRCVSSYLTIQYNLVAFHTWSYCLTWSDYGVWRLFSNISIISWWSYYLTWSDYGV
jgi:hypothetical protein